MIFDFDPNKADENFHKHSISFNQAWMVFNKKSTKRHFYDDEHTTVFEKRFYALGKLKKHGVIRINYTIRAGRIRMNTPGLFEPPVRNLRATIPDGESHQKYYSTVLLT